MTFEPPHTAGGNVKWDSHFGKAWQVFKGQTVPSNSPLRYTPRETKHTAMQNMCADAHRVTICSSQKAETTQMSPADEWIKCDTFLQWNIIFQ